MILKLIFIFFFLATEFVYALPIGFKINQGNLVYRQLKHPDFRLLHDQRTEKEARFLLQSAIAAKPILDKWFQKKRQSPLLITSSAVTSGASFANFITDGIELQTLGRGDRDLILHEYIHMMMLLYFHNLFGPAGAIVHMPWLPAWWIEGLAEALTVAYGSDTQYGIERYQALSNNFLSYEQLHDLYGSSIQYRGYNTSGRFLSYILTMFKSPEALRQLHEEFKSYTMPWYWPLTIIPFADTLPIDMVLKKHTGFTGRKLYRKYKQEKKLYWQKNKPPVFLTGKEGKRYIFTRMHGMQTKANDLVTLTSYDDGLYIAKVIFDEKTGLATGIEKTKTGSAKKRVVFIPRLGVSTYIKYDKQAKSGLPYHKLIRVNGSQETILQEGEFSINDIFELNNKLVFLEQEFSTTSLCYYEQKDWSKHCPLRKAYPQSLHVIGYEEKLGRIWLRLQTETLTGQLYKLVTWNAQEGVKTVNWPFISKPLKVVFRDSKPQFLISERRFRSIIELDSKWRCRRKIRFADHLTGLFNLNNQMIVALYHHDGHVLARPSKEEINRSSRPCRSLSSHSSPLLYAMQQKSIPSLAKAMARYETGINTKDPDKTVASPPMKSTKVEWRGRPLFAFPLIGAEDALGWQIGVISVPLMDNLQNETLVAGFMYGLTSRYPAISLNLISTRYWPTLSLSLFKRQTYNGSDTKGYVSYYDELGVNTSMTTQLYLSTTKLIFTLGLSSSRLKNYLGSRAIPQGMASYLSLGITWTGKFSGHDWSARLWQKIYPPGINKIFNYYRLGLELTWITKLPFWHSKLVSGAEATATRGKKTKNLQELYQALQTYIAGSEGGINKIGIPVISNGELFSFRHGDTKARTKIAWIVPVIKDFDKLLWILYIDRLNFSAFYNYGGAWNQQDGLQQEDLVFAHGYSLDLLLNNKGIKFNLGLGTGQVAYNPFEVYINFGFDALF